MLAAALWRVLRAFAEPGGGSGGDSEGDSESDSEAALRAFARAAASEPRSAAAREAFWELVEGAARRGESLLAVHPRFVCELLRRLERAQGQRALRLHLRVFCLGMSWRQARRDDEGLP